MNLPRSHNASTSDKGSQQSLPRARLVILARAVIILAISALLWKCYTFKCFNYVEVLWVTAAGVVAILALAGVLRSSERRRFRSHADRTIPMGSIVFRRILLISSVAAIIGLIVKGVAQMPPLFEAWECQELTYNQYMRAVGEDYYFDPKGASHIYFRSRVVRNSNWVFRKLTIPPESYKSLLARCSIEFETGEQVRKTTTAKLTFPDNWPLPWGTPDWWQPLEVGRNAECTRWEHQYLPGHASGQYWVYDPESSTLWTWYWVCGHDLSRKSRWSSKQNRS